MFKCVIDNHDPTFWTEEVASAPSTPEWTVRTTKYFETKAEAESWAKQYINKILEDRAADVKTIEDLVRFAASADMSGWCEDTYDGWSKCVYERKCKEFGIRPY